MKNAYGPEKPVIKYECIGYYQKRVGTRLRKKKSHVKGLGGKGRLPNAKINTLHNYLGIALRQNDGDIDKMISACRTSMFYVAGYYEIVLKIENCCARTNRTYGTKYSRVDQMKFVEDYL